MLKHYASLTQNGIRVWINQSFIEDSNFYGMFPDQIESSYQVSK
jgi:hypothetical protein